MLEHLGVPGPIMVDWVMVGTRVVLPSYVGLGVLIIIVFYNHVSMLMIMMNSWPLVGESVMVISSCLCIWDIY